MYSDRFCDVTCPHGGVCTLEPDHVGAHNASGFCTWLRNDNDRRETEDEVVMGMVAVMMSNVGRKEEEK